MTWTDDISTRAGRWFFAILLVVATAGWSGCATWPNRDPLMIDVAGIEPLPGEGMELRLLVKIRVQNPNDAAVDYSGIALTLDLNDIGCLPAERRDAQPGDPVISLDRTGISDSPVALLRDRRLASYAQKQAM